MDKKSEEVIMKAYCDNLDKVRHAGLLEGSTAILGAVLEMCNSGASVGKIKKFCQDALKKTGKK